MADARAVHCLHEPFDVYVGRPSDFGNPFPTRTIGGRRRAVAAFARYLAGNPELIARVQAELKGRRLGCWCHPRACHADILAAVAEMTAEELEAWRSSWLSSPSSGGSAATSPTLFPETDF